MKNIRGGILFDLFRILVIVGIGAIAWWTQDRWMPERWRSIVWKATGRPSTAPAEGEDWTARGARWQSEFRRLLSEAGVADRHVLKSLNETHEDAQGRWVTSVLEVESPSVFHSGHFLKALAPLLNEAGWSILEDRNDHGRWVLALGAEGRVFQRLVVNPQRRAEFRFLKKGNQHV